MLDRYPSDRACASADDPPGRQGSAFIVARSRCTPRPGTRGSPARSAQSASGPPSRGRGRSSRQEWARASARGYARRRPRPSSWLTFAAGSRSAHGPHLVRPDHGERNQAHQPKPIRDGAGIPAHDRRHSASERHGTARPGFAAADDSIRPPCRTRTQGIARTRSDRRDPADGSGTPRHPVLPTRQSR